MTWRMRQLPRWLHISGAVIALFLSVAVAGSAWLGCERARYNPDMATRPYPYDLHRAESINVQVFRDGPNIDVINATTRSFQDFDLWINQRFVQRIDALPAGQIVRLSLWDFYDVRGETLVAGGLLRTDPATPVKLVEIQTAAEAPLIGLVAIRSEDEDP